MDDTLIEISQENIECVVCLDSINSENPIWVCPQCNIKIHEICIKNLKKEECPHCRYNFTETIEETLTEIPSYRRIRIRQGNRIESICYICVSNRITILWLAIILFASSIVGCCVLLIPTILSGRVLYNNFSKYE